MKVIIEASARHVHLSKADLETLFGSGYELKYKKELSQPGQFACEERIDIEGTKGVIKGVSILGPTRNITQVEISLSDARKIGVQALIRESGDLNDTNGVKLIGPAGSIVLEKGCISAKRHIHLSPDEAKDANVIDKEVVMVKIITPNRSLIFDDVVVRVNENFRAAMHIDTDESNAAGIDSVTYGEIIKK
ncbi:phosphate propanoyltransferase [Eubacteriales bacterium OttesenSCG-928-G02]|nr:phosphate propanoyltransferase [Eubacteriales bacterium OttesenSCG-928-G02]